MLYLVVLSLELAQRVPEWVEDARLSILGFEKLETVVEQSLTELVSPLSFSCQ